MQEIDLALAQVSEIRSHLAASTRFRGFAPEALAVTGLVALLVMLAQVLWPERLAADDRQQVLVWGGGLVLSCIAMGIEAVARARRQHGGMAASMLRGSFRAVMPISLAGAMLAFAILAYTPEASRLIPGIWLMLIGLVAFSSYGAMPPAIVWAGLWYLVSGAFVLVLAGQGGKLEPWMMGVPLVAGHAAIAWILRRGGGTGQ
jgi:hypothetical protein